MQTYSGSDKRLQFLFEKIFPTYSTSGRPYGTWIDGSQMNETVLVITISNASSVDEVIYDLSVLGASFIEIISATLDTTTEVWPIVHELHVDGSDLVYNGAHGTGTAYVTIHYV